jgi:hypothetical protein
LNGLDPAELTPQAASLIGVWDHLGESVMTWSEFEGHWPQLQQRIRWQWRRLSEGDVADIRGRREALVDRVKERYGLSQEQAEREVEAWAFFVRIPEAA